MSEPTCEYGRLSLGLAGNVLFFPKVRVLKNGLRRRVGKPLTVGTTRFSSAWEEPIGTWRRATSEEVLAWVRWCEECEA